MWKKPNEKRAKTPVKEEEKITEPVPSEENDFGMDHFLRGMFNKIEVEVKQKKKISSIIL